MTDWDVHLANVLHVSLVGSGGLNDCFCTALNDNSVELINLLMDLVITIQRKLQKYISH